MAKAPKLNLYPSVLSFEKKIVPSDAYFYSTTWDNRYNTSKPVAVIETAMRGFVSTRSTSEFNTPNLQNIDTCFLPSNHDTLHLKFTIKIIGGLDAPHACNNIQFKQRYIEVLNNYISTYNFTELARRYALNIANGRFLWRNRVLSDQIEIIVSTDDQSWTFNARQYSPHHFDIIDEKIDNIATLMASALKNETPCLLLTINCYAKIGDSQELFPSQNLILNKKDTKSRSLYSISGQAAFTARKIGNAIRTIDTWYKDEATPISIEIYGTEISTLQAHRTPGEKNDFYTLFDKYIKDGDLENEDDKHFVIANLIRGGVFGKSEKD